MTDLLLGAIAALATVAGLIFVRYWLSTRDRFFILLALAFWLEAASRVHMALAHAFNEAEPTHYVVRLISYGLIIFAIWDKNRLPPR